MYRFETNVIRINIDKPLDEKQAYSILQAFIISACSVLNIDDNEITGCLQSFDDGTYNYVLYDTTLGGADYVKSLNNERQLVSFFKEAYNKTKYCKRGDQDGDSSCYCCPRTYRNQRHHDDLMRGYVYSYLEEIVDAL